MQIGSTQVEVLGLGPAHKLYEDEVIPSTNAAEVMKKLTKMLDQALRKNASLQREVDLVKDKAAKLDFENHKIICGLRKQVSDLKVEAQLHKEDVATPSSHGALPVPVTDFNTLD
jgi:FtsZ-binding cell division protein ZapB